MSRQASRAGMLAVSLDGWFHSNKRALPFRDTHDPYKIWLSEILAQQTRITALLPYYERFIERFPTLHHLAAASEPEVLSLWAGLGYYARARHLLAAALMVENKYGGVFPSQAEELRKLPGVGAYTAGAVASIAFSLPEPAVDGNVRRVYARIETAGDAKAEPWVRALMEHAPPPVVTEALMELGALVCLPKIPRCEACPVCLLCKAKENGQTEQFPLKENRPEKRREALDICLCFDSGGQVLLRRRTERLLHNLWVFPDEQTLLREGFRVEKFPPAIGTARHVFTHIVWEMTGWLAKAEVERLPDNYRYVNAEAPNLAMPSAMRYWTEWIILNRN